MRVRMSEGILPESWLLFGLDLWIPWNQYGVGSVTVSALLCWSTRGWIATLALLSDAAVLQCFLFKCLPKTPMQTFSFSFEELERCLSVDGRRSAVHVFLFLPALYRGCFLKVVRGAATWHMPPRSPPLMKADPLRVRDLTAGGEWDGDCGNIFCLSRLSRTVQAGVGVTCC